MMTDDESIAALLQRRDNLILPLTRGPGPTDPAAELLQRRSPAALFPAARSPQGAVSGLLLLLNCWDASHQISQDVATPEGSYWHAIAHRIEPDASNAGYWFRRVGRHPIFPRLHTAAAEVLAGSHSFGWKLAAQWDPAQFIDWCEQARHQGESGRLKMALAIQKLEWNLLFAWCHDPAA